MNALALLLRQGILIIDAILRRLYGVWEFSQDPRCLLRISLSHSPMTTTLADGTRLRTGDPICIIHLWNERVPPIGSSGATLAWARTMRANMAHSLRLLAAYAAADPRLHHVVAFGGETSIFTAQALGRSQDLLGKWGFDYIEAESKRLPQQRLRRFLDRMYAWALMWAFNPGTLRSKTFSTVGRCYIWISRQELLARYR